MFSISGVRKHVAVALCVSFGFAGDVAAAVGNPQNLPNDQQWGLDRIDQRASLDSADRKYYHDLDGSGVLIYVVDMAAGLTTAHPEFVANNDSAINRLRILGNFTTYCVASGGSGGGGGGSCPKWNPECPQTKPNQNYYAPDDTPLNEHGWHVAGIAGSLSYGVAKNAEIVSVPAICLNDDGDPRDVVAAIDAILADYNSRKSATPLGVLPAVANFSITFEPNDENAACILGPRFQALRNAGIAVVVASGNKPVGSTSDSCANFPQQFAMFSAGQDSSTPAQCSAFDQTSEYYGGIIGVGNSDWNDTRSATSRTGSCVDIYAPGSSIRSVSPTLTGGSSVKSGTSQAAPFVTGRIAQLLESNPRLLPTQVESFVRQMGTNVANLEQPLVYTGDVDGGARSTSSTTSISSSSVGGGQYLLQWQVHPNRQYLLYRATNSSFFGQVLVDEVAPGDPGQHQTPVLPGGTYYYRLLDCDASLIDCRKYVTLSSPIVVGGPACPSGVPCLTESTGVGVTATGEYTLNWTAVSGYSIYKLERSMYPNFSSPATIYSGPALSKFEDVNLQVTRYYRVRACPTQGACTGYSNVVSVEYTNF